MVLLSTRTPSGDGERRLGRRPARAEVAVGPGTDMGSVRSIAAQPAGCSPGVDGGAGDGAPGMATTTCVVCTVAAGSCIPRMHQILIAVLSGADAGVKSRN